MNLILRRTSFTEHGIFGGLFTEAGDLLMYTLEHAYHKEGGGFEPKVPAGRYLCKRGMHRLKLSKAPFETFEVEGVPKHSGILFHIGNFNEDSQGCILVGSSLTGTSLVHSTVAFNHLMTALDGIDEFKLTIKPEVS